MFFVFPAQIISLVRAPSADSLAKDLCCSYNLCSSFGVWSVTHRKLWSNEHTGHLVAIGGFHEPVTLDTSAKHCTSHRLSTCPRTAWQHFARSLLSVSVSIYFKQQTKSIHLLESSHVPSAVFEAHLGNCTPSVNVTLIEKRRWGHCCRVRCQ